MQKNQKNSIGQFFIKLEKPHVSFWFKKTQNKIFFSKTSTPSFFKSDNILTSRNKKISTCGSGEKLRTNRRTDKRTEGIS